MILLDTNVISEMMRPAPAPDVLAWLDACAYNELYVSAVTRAEILLGIELLPPGRRRTAIAETAERLFTTFTTPILPFDAEAAAVFATIASDRRRAGRPMDVLDAQIAAIARCHNAALATRDLADFAHCGVRLINPWRSGR